MQAIWKASKELWKFGDYRELKEKDITGKEANETHQVWTSGEVFLTPTLFWVILSAHHGTPFELKQTVEITSPENLGISTAHKMVSRLNKTMLYG